MAHLLVVDDDPEIIKDVQVRLKSMGHTCDSAGSQQAAEELLAINTYDLYLLDLEIPLEKGGLLSTEFGRNLMDKILRTPVQRDKPIIVITGHDIDSYHIGIEMSKRGAFDMVGKPFGTKHPLETKIREALRAHAAIRGRRLAREAGALNQAETPFTGGTLDFYPDRVELRGEKIAGPEGKSQMRQVLDLLKMHHLSGERRTLDGNFIARELGFERGQFTVNEAVRQIRDVCTRVMAKKCHLVCGTNDVITNEYRGYVFAPGIQVREPGTAIPKDSSAGTTAKANGENALSEIQSAILHELRTSQSVSRKSLSGSLQIKPAALNSELAQMVKLGLVTKEGCGAATRYKLANHQSNAD